MYNMVYMRIMYPPWEKNNYKNKELDWVMYIKRDECIN